MTSRISIAYSPDSDDAFMVQALLDGRIDHPGYEFDFHTADIQELNERAAVAEFDVTAISVAAYPGLAADYLLLPVGSSIGDNFGPALVVRSEADIKSIADLAGKTIAIPGLQTSAYFAARALVGQFNATPMHFLEIDRAVRNGEVDCGILIHEMQVDCEHGGLRKIGDLGSLWKAKFDLPLPLGGNAIRRKLGRDAIREVTNIYRASIVAGLENREETLTRAMASARTEINRTLGDRYISMYVNEDTLTLSPAVRQAIATLFAAGAEAGLCPNLADTDYIVDEQN